MKKITLLDVKHALKDERFRKILPESLTEGVNKFMKDPGCACHAKFIKQVLKEAQKQLFEYYPAATEITDPEKEAEKLAKNNWRVISCHIDELENKLQSLPYGRKQLDIARWEDQVTVVINELEIVF